MARWLQQIIFQNHPVNAAHYLDRPSTGLDRAFVHSRLVHLVRVPSHGHGPGDSETSGAVCGFGLGRLGNVFQQK